MSFEHLILDVTWLTQNWNKHPLQRQLAWHFWQRNDEDPWWGQSCSFILFAVLFPLRVRLLCRCHLLLFWFPSCRRPSSSKKTAQLEEVERKKYLQNVHKKRIDSCLAVPVTGAVVWSLFWRHVFRSNETQSQRVRAVLKMELTVAGERFKMAWCLTRIRHVVLTACRYLTAWRKRFTSC